MNSIIIIPNAGLKEYYFNGIDKVKYELNEKDMSIRNILKDIGLYGEVGIILLNDKTVNDRITVKPGDTIKIYSILDGG